MPDYSLEQGFSIQTHRSASVLKSSGMGEVSKPPISFVRNADSWVPTRLTESNILGMGTRHRYFNPAFPPQ